MAARASATSSTTLAGCQAQPVMRQLAHRRSRKRKAEPGGQADAAGQRLILGRQKVMRRIDPGKILVARIAVEDGGGDDRAGAVIGAGKGRLQHLFEGAQRAVIGMAAPADVAELAHRAADAGERGVFPGEQRASQA